MMKRSFAENDSVCHEVDRKQALQDLEQSIRDLQKLDCPICSEDIDSYYSARARITYLKREMQVGIPCSMNNSDHCISSVASKVIYVFSILLP